MAYNDNNSNKTKENVNRLIVAKKKQETHERTWIIFNHVRGEWKIATTKICKIGNKVGNHVQLELAIMPKVGNNANYDRKLLKIGIFEKYAKLSKNGKKQKQKCMTKNDFFFQKKKTEKIIIQTKKN